MAFGLLEDLAVTKGLREALPYLTSLVEAEPALSARSIISTLRSQGLSFGDAGAFNIISQLKANLDVRELFQTTDLTSLPEIESLERAVSPLSKNYSFLVSIKGFNGVTGERETRHVTIVSDTLLTPEQILTTAQSLPSGAPGSQVLGNSTISIEAGFRSPFTDT